MKNRRLIGISVALLFSLAVTPFKELAVSNSVGYRKVAQGEIVELKLPAADITEVRGQLGKEIIQFFSENGAYKAIVGVDVEARPGPIKLVAIATTRSGERREMHFNLEVKPKRFKTEELSVAPEFDHLSPEVLERIRREQAQFERVFAASAPVRLWESAFLQPLSGQITSPFGFRRIVNGKPRAPHTGTDLRAAVGTPIAAANHGRVVLVGDFFYSGNSVVLDHGAGLFTMYFHLSDITVEQGALIRKGDPIGLSGMSGRVTGPHLHWAARVNNARIDPFELIDKLGSAMGESGGITER